MPTRAAATTAGSLDPGGLRSNHTALSLARSRWSKLLSMARAWHSLEGPLHSSRSLRARPAVPLRRVLRSCRMVSRPPKGSSARSRTHAPSPVGQTDSLESQASPGCCPPEPRAYKCHGGAAAAFLSIPALTVQMSAASTSCTLAPATSVSIPDMELKLQTLEIGSHALPAEPARRPSPRGSLKRTHLPELPEPCMAGDSGDLDPGQKNSDRPARLLS